VHAEELGSAAALDAEAQRALGLLQAGRLSETDALCRRILSLHPTHFHALHLRGIVAFQSGYYPEAAQLFASAAASDPRQAAAYSNLGASLLRLRRPREALSSCERALELQPTSAEALSNRGNAFAALGRPDEALASYQRAIALAPGLLDAHFGRANVLLSLGKFQDALAEYERVLQIHPNHIDALSNRGNALLKLDRLEAALATFDEVLRCSPDHAEALNGRGSALRRLRRPAEALASYRRALELRPDFAEVFHNVAEVYLQVDKPESAIESCDRALALRPDFADALNLRVTALGNLGRYTEAAASCARLLEMQPRSDFAPGERLNALAMTCDWTNRERERSELVRAVEAGGRACLPFCFLALSDSPAAQLQCARAFAAARFPAVERHWRAPRYQHERIRIAYVSSDLREHAVSYLLAGVFEQHDLERFDTFAISLRSEPGGALAQRLRAAFTRFVDASARSDDEIAALMRELEIDVAVDLNGYTAGARTELFTRRVAPVQVNYLGFPGTLGLDCIDYLIADEVVIPRGEERWYAEQVVRLPHCYLPTDDRRVIGPSPTRAQAGLPEKGVVYCAFTKAYKLNPELFDVWMRVLQGVPGSVLWLAAMAEDARGNLAREARARGVNEGRLVFAAHVPSMAEHLGRQGLADLYLDTVPYNAHSTACDALWAGVPVLTCTGRSFAGRVAASALHAMGLGELVTHSLHEYEAVAVRLGRDAQDLERLKSRLREQRSGSALFDTAASARALEAAYRGMYERAQRAEPPATFDAEWY
jgi:protein O-GlcNAc transferase